MAVVNHLRDKDGQNLFHAVAYGKHLVTGHLTKSFVTGSSPTHVVTLQQMLGRGEWDGCEGLWWNGEEIESDKYHLHTGAQAVDMSGVDVDFDTDTPHSGVAWIKAELGAGFGEVDNKTTPPEGLKGIFRTTKCTDYDADGDETDYEYSTNPALQVADLIVRIGQIPKSRIDWTSWYAWRQFLAENISFDYLALPDFDGFGLTGSYYNGTAFDTLLTTRIDPVILFVSSAGSVAVGQDVDNFSVRWEGWLKPKHGEDYTFYVTHTHGAKLWVDEDLIIDEWSSTGEHDGLITLAGSNNPVEIKLEWKHTTGNADIKLEWESDTQDREIIPHKALYPKVVSRPRYETHPFFAGPTRLDDAVRTILNLCNSTMQEVGGKLKFFCLEQLASPSFHFTNSKILDGSLQTVPRDIRNLRNTWQARFRDIDSRFLEYPIDPILIERPDMIEAAGRRIDGEAIEMFNCTMHQGYRMLDNIVRRNIDSRWQPITLSGNADTFPVLAGDRVEVDIEFRDLTEVDCLVLESNDSSSEDTADERTFTLQEWPDFPEYT